MQIGNGTPNFHNYIMKHIMPNLQLNTNDSLHNSNYDLYLSYKHHGFLFYQREIWIGYTKLDKKDKDMLKYN